MATIQNTLKKKHYVLNSIGMPFGISKNKTKPFHEFEIAPAEPIVVECGILQECD